MKIKTHSFMPLSINSLELYPRKFIRRGFLIGWVALILSESAISQELPNVVHPSPEVAALFKYMDYPVSFTTGLPQINIPLYEVRSGSISVPISISYHSSGRKVYDETGAIGLGWSLLAGGSVSRVIYGDEDDNDNVVKFPSPWKKQADINPLVRADADYLEGVVRNYFPIQWYDTEYDVFSYSVNSISGRFVFRDDNNTKIPVLIPKKPYLIDYQKATTQSNINYFASITLVDDSGTTYQFGNSLKNVGYYETSSASSGISAWMLTEIVSADKVDTISFKYENFSKDKRSVSQKTILTDDQINCSGGSYIEYDHIDDNTGTFSDVNYSTMRLVEIKFRNGVVKFNLQNGTDLISDIRVLNLKGEIIRIIEFNQSALDILSDGNAPTKKLESIVIKSSNNSSSDIYEFDYYPTVYGSSNEVVDGRFRDLWGYYNASGQIGMRPLENVQVMRFGGSQPITIGDQNSIRTPNESATKSGVLKRITFPTGGWQEFVYQQNQYMDPSTAQIKPCGGLRLLQTILNEGTGNSIYKTYKYGVNELGYGVLPLIPSIHNMSYETRHQNFLVSESTCVSTCAEIGNRVRIFSSDVLPIFSEFHQRPVFYEEVTEYHGTLTNNTGKTTYKYDMGNQLGHPNSVQNLFINNDHKYWKESSLIEKRDYKKVNTSFQEVRRVNNFYSETVYNSEKIWGLHVGKYYYITPDYLIDPYNSQYVPSYFPTGVSSCGSAPVGLDKIFRFADYTISVGKKELIKTIDKLFLDNGQAIETITEYNYNENHLMSTITKHGSSNETQIIENKYPFDFTETVYNEMVNRNMLSYEVEVNNFKNNEFLSSTKTVYKNWGNNQIKPEIISLKTGSAPYEPRIAFHSYDENANIQSVSKDNGPKVNYLWGYNRSLPIAKIDNGEINQLVESVSKTLTAPIVQVPGNQSEPQVFQTGIVIDFAQNITLSCTVDRTGANPTIPDHYFNVNVSLLNIDTEASYGGTFGLTSNSSVVLNNVPAGNYVLQYQYGGDIGSETFTFQANLDYQALQVYSTVFQTSFEEDIWNINSTALTGRKSHSGTYTVNLPKQNGEYILSYWTKQGGNAWEYNEEPITITPSSQYTRTIGSGGTLVDEVRLYPKSAQMTTYTYDPLIGMTSMSDPNNVTTYYEYDDFGRLKHTKDNDQNIVQKFEYHYREQQGQQ